MVIVGMVIIMMMGVRISGMNTGEKVQPILGMRVMRMDKGRDAKKRKYLKSSQKDQSSKVIYELVHG